MSKLTERMIQAAVLLAILFYGWGLSRDTFVLMIQLERRAVVAEQRVQQLLEAQKPPAPPPTPSPSPPTR